MLFVTDCIQLVQRIPDNESLEGCEHFKIGEEVIRTLKYTDDFVLLAKEETVLQSMTDRLTESRDDMKWKLM